MDTISTTRMLNIIGKTLDLMDSRLVDHGTSVAKMVYAVLRRQGGYTEREMRDICILAVLHDVGAYKTEEINRMAQFESDDVWAHSIYGYLYVLHFLPLPDLAVSILFHHATHDKFERFDSPVYRIGQIIHVADRVDIMRRFGNIEGEKAFLDYFLRQRGKRFQSEIIDLFIESGVFGMVAEDRLDVADFSGNGFTEEEMEAYLKMVVMSIDFRSPQTVTHTISATVAATKLAELVGMDAGRIDKIRTGAMLHDIGKQGIPPEILESKNRLSPKEMEVMKTHVSITDMVIAGNVDEDTRRLAVRHHEKLDGSGYPKGLGAADLNLGERIVAIADIFSALCGTRSYKQSFDKDKVLGILGDMARSGLLDPELVSVCVDRYEDIVGAVDLRARETIRTYRAMEEGYATLMAEVESFLADGNLPENLERILKETQRC